MKPFRAFVELPEGNMLDAFLSGMADWSRCGPRPGGKVLICARSRETEEGLLVLPGAVKITPPFDPFDV